MARSDFRFSYPFRVRYAETDQQGCVFNAHYLTWFDTAITEYLRHLGWDYRAYMATGVDFHTVRSLVEYRAPVRFDEEIDVYVRPTRLGQTSILWQMEIHAGMSEQMRSSGEVIWVNTDQRIGRSVPLPDRLRDLVTLFEGMADDTPGLV